MLLQQRLKRIRSEKSLTIEQLALLVGIPGRTISSYERGEHIPPASYLALLNEHLQVNLNYLLSGKGSLFLPHNELLRYEQLIRDEYNLSERDIELVRTVIDFLHNRVE